MRFQVEEWRLAGIERGLAELDKHLPMSPTMDGRLPLHQDCRELVAEVRRLQGVEREALHVLGAIINQHVQGRVDVPEEALRREYMVSRTTDPASMTVRFRAEPVDER